MTLHVNIEDILNKRKVESDRIEFKLGWNPVDVYHSICAFANDIDNLGGGYIITDNSLSHTHSMVFLVHLLYLSHRNG